MNKAATPQQGFTLLELMISIFIISIGVIAIFSVTAKYTQQTASTRESLVASYLGQEGVEIVKNIRDINWVKGNGWNSGLTSCSSGCEADYASSSLVSSTSRYLYIDNATGFYQYTPGSEGGVVTPYKRIITVTNPGSDEVDIQVDVTWNGYTITVKENLYNWKP